MNFIEKIKDWFFSLFDPKVNWKEIDKSNLVFSDWKGSNFTENNGWVKGWVKSPNTAVVCSHSNPFVGGEIFVVLNGEKVKRIITHVLTLDRVTDIAIVQVDAPWADGVKIYKTAKKVKDNQKAVRFHKDGDFSECRLDVRGDTVEGRFWKRDVESGDSGLPWFIWDEKEKQFFVASHNHRGKDGVSPDSYGRGIGPNYSEVL